ncbi:GDP-mannose 4,6-dehydratase [Amylibacter sp.]|nr:GDP-mannose 4,6-dehydratase [Amylibacter sp.]
MALEICLVLGVNGQDGSYAAEKFIQKGYAVIGIGRQKHSKWLQETSTFKYIQVDLNCFDSVLSVLRKEAPDIIFNAAAVHGPANFSYESVWRDVQLVNVGLTHGILEYLRLEASSCFYMFLSSSKAFSSNENSVLDEKSPRSGECIYSITKNASTDLIKYYRLRYKLKASVVWTFNHESPRRGKQFFVPKIVDILAKSIVDSTYKSTIYTLDFFCDWGDAEEFMEISTEICERKISDDFILATGKSIFAKEFVEKFFSNHGLSYRDHIDVSHTLGSPKYVVRAELSKLQSLIKKTPSLSVYEVAEKILASRS